MGLLKAEEEARAAEAMKAAGSLPGAFNNDDV